MTFISNNQINFCKYQANGNDFILIEEKNDEQLFSFLKNHADIICNRNYGIGSDGILLIKKVQEKIIVRVINQDKSEALNCGNGLRCVARWYFNQSPNTKIILELGKKSYEASKENEDIIIDMGECSLMLHSEVHFSKITGCIANFFVDVKNLHLVWIFRAKPDVDKAIKEIKNYVTNFEDYNHGFLWCEDKEIFSIVFERGVGFTKSCGSGAIAAACSFFTFKKNNKEIKLTINQPGGGIEVLIKPVFTNEEKTIMHTQQLGSAKKVFEGLFESNYLKNTLGMTD